MSGRVCCDWWPIIKYISTMNLVAVEWTLCLDNVAWGVELDLGVALIGVRLSGEGVSNNACSHYEILWPLMTTTLNSGILWRGNRFGTFYPFKVSTEDMDV